MTFILVAPNGARKTKADHPRIPLSHMEIVEESLACFAAGAAGVHLHVRNDDGTHCLDINRYAKLLDTLRAEAPDLYLQITTEAGGIYAPAEQRAVVDTLHPDGVSVAVREMAAEPNTTLLADWYASTTSRGVEIQHIVYDLSDLQTLMTWSAQGIVGDALSVLIVLGRYHPMQQSSLADLDAIHPSITACSAISKRMVCAFGPAEQACLLHSIQQGYDVRIGFENNHFRTDGSLADSNVEQLKNLICSSPDLI